MSQFVASLVDIQQVWVKAHYLLDGRREVVNDFRNHRVLSHLGKQAAHIALGGIHHFRNLGLRLNTMEVFQFPGRSLFVRDARQQINQAAWRIGSPWIDMAVDGPSLLCRVSTYLPGTGSVCLECSWDASDYRLLGQVLPCDENRGSQDLEETEKEESESPG